MAETTEIKQGTFISTMLISKMHKRENYNLSANVKYTLMHPKLSMIPLYVISFGIFLSKLLAGVIFVLITGIVLPNVIVFLLAFILGYIVMDQIVKYFYNKPQASVSELNTFLIASKIIDPKSNTNFKTTSDRVDFENKIKFLHDSYKKDVFCLIDSEVRKDFELRYSIKVIRNVASDINVQFDKDAVNDLYNWVSMTLEKIYKGTRISYWDNKDGKFRLVVTNTKQEREFIETKVDLSDIVDELNLLIFSNHYKDAMDPIFSDLQYLIKPFLDQNLYKEYASSNEEKNDHFSECLRILYSKTLGMQEVLKMTKRQFDRMNEAKRDLNEESKHIQSPELVTLVEQFSSNGSMEDLLQKLLQIITSLSFISKNLRSLDYNHVPRFSTESFRTISNLIFELEKLRFISNWFEDIASYTNVSGGSVTDIDSSGKEIVPEEVTLRVKDVYKTFSTAGGTVYAVRGVSFDIKQGEFIGLYGPSGSGKTTLLNIMAGLDHPDAGNIYIDGVSTQSLSGKKLTALRRDKMGFVFQFYNLIPVLKNQENVAYPAEIGGSKNASQASALLEAVELKKFENQYPNKLSGGQMQRVTIARSLINTPKILFADEPTGDLDSVTGKEVMNLLARFNKENKTTVIFVTHDKSLLSYCSRVIHMTDGKIMKE